MSSLSLDNKKLGGMLTLSLLLTFSAPIFFPKLRLFFLVPFLVTAAYQKTRLYCLYLSFFTGLFLDLLTSDAHIGLYAFSYCITMLLLYGQKRNFFADSLSTLAFMTFLFSSTITFVLALLLYNIELINIFSWHWIAADLLIMPIIDSVYAFSFFILPSLLFAKPRRKGKDYFLISE